jgi:hypothetical protein
MSDAQFMRGTPLSLSFRVASTVAGRVRPWWFDGVAAGGRQYGAANVFASQWETLSVTFSPSATSSSAYFGIEITPGTSCTVYVDNAMLVMGAVAADYAPPHPADDLARCQRYYEKIGGEGSSAPDITGYASAGQGVNLSMRFLTRKAVSPSATKVGTWGVTNCGQPYASAGGTDMVTLQAVTTAGPAFVGYKTNSPSEYFVIEANP